MEKHNRWIKYQRQGTGNKLKLQKIDILILIMTLFGLLGYRHCMHVADHHQIVIEQQAKARAAKIAKEKAAAAKKRAAKSVMRTPINWKESSEKVPYPNLNNVKNFWIKVALLKNRTYLMSGNKVIYTMYCSGGLFHKDPNTGKMVSDTPTGTYQIQPERGQSFFNNSLNEGANYWVSWKDNGVYLFHTVPTKKDGSYNVPEAEKLGKQPASHGCIRLSVPDAKWMMQNLKVGTKVVVQND